MKKIFDLCGIGSPKRRKRLFSGQAFLVVRIAFPVYEPALAAHFSGVILFSIPVELAIGDTMPQGGLATSFRRLTHFVRRLPRHAHFILQQHDQTKTTKFATVKGAGAGKKDCSH